MTDHGRQGHLESGEVAAYLDGTMPSSDRVGIQAHAQECESCRHELIEVTRLLRTLPRRRVWYLPVGIAAAAAVALLLVWPRAPEESGSPGTREPALTTTVAPGVIAPQGVVANARMLTWTAVPHADRYRLTVFDTTGRPVWEAQASDTSTLLPDSIRFQPGTPYLWKVEARTSWNRWVSSDLTEFSVAPPQP